MSADFHAQIASIMEVLANAAVAEICKVVEDGYEVVNLEMSRSKKENESLRRKVKLLELLVARYRAERGKEGSMVSRWSGVRLLNRQNREGPSLQGRTRCLNRDQGTRQSMQKIMPMNLHQDADQEVTKTKPAEPEEEGELLIIKVEGTMEMPTTNQEAPADPCTSSKGDTHAATSLPAASKDTRRPEVSGSDTVTFVVGRTAETGSSSDTTYSSQLELTGSDVRAGDRELLNSDAGMTPSRDAVPASCGDVMDNNAALDISKCSLSEMIVIDGGVMSEKEGERCVWSDIDQTKSEITTSFVVESVGHGSVHGKSSLQAGSFLPCNDTPGGGTSSSIKSPVSLDHPASLHRHLSSSLPMAFYNAVTMERPYGCTSCTKRFFLESDLQKHVARHTREKPYTCLLCGKSFVCHSQLDIHRNVHTGERPFSCSVCSRRFAHPSNLKRHQRIQHLPQRPDLPQHCRTNGLEPGFSLEMTTYSHCTQYNKTRSLLNPEGYF